MSRPPKIGLRVPLGEVFLHETANILNHTFHIILAESCPFTMCRAISQVRNSSDALLSKQCVSTRPCKICIHCVKFWFGGKGNCFWQVGLAHFGGLIWPTPRDVK